jgi:hypothetical protein
LNDHLAASLAALELARHAAANNSETSMGDRLTDLARELQEDRDALQGIMDQLGVGKDRVKLTLGWTAEKVGRLKLNGSLLSYSPLSRLEELELLLLGVEGRLLLCETLGRLPQAEQLEPELEQLTVRARSHRQLLRRLRRQAASTAFT